MKSWIVRFASLYVFNIVVLIVIDLLTPARVGFHVIWAAVILTLAEMFVRPLVHGWMSKAAAKSAGQRTRAGEALVQVGIVFVVAAVVWVLTLLLSGATARGWFWAWVLPPVIISIGWLVYARIDSRLQATAGSLYDRIRGSGAAPAASTPPVSPATAEARQELKDGLTPEQRRMLDELG